MNTPVNKDDALQYIGKLIEKFGITLAEISNLEAAQKSKDWNVLIRMLTVVGALLILAGISYFITSFWSDMGRATRVLIVYGPGLIAFVGALATLNDENYGLAYRFLLLLSSVLQTSGIYVFLKEYGSGNNYHLALTTIFAPMALQYCVCFLRYKDDYLLTFFCLFSLLLVINTMDWIGLERGYTASVAGLSTLMIAYGIEYGKRFLVTSKYLYVLGSSIFLWGVFEVLKGNPLETLFALLSSTLIYLSLKLKNRDVLIISAVSLFCYISYFSKKYIAESLGWSLTLVMLGIIMLSISFCLVNAYKKQGKA